MGHDCQDTTGSKGAATLGSLVLSRLRDILSIAPENFMLERASPGCSDPFRTLVATVLSQNTNDKNSYRAFVELDRAIGVVPRSLADAPLGSIEDAVRSAGLYRSKAAKLKSLSLALLERFGGDMGRILSMEPAAARSALIALPGVGPKTADVVLLFCAGMPFFPVDTHVARVSKRLGLADEGAGYEEIRRSLEAIFDPTDYGEAHKLLIQHGRTFCRARGPRCAECPLSDICRWRSRGQR